MQQEEQISILPEDNESAKYKTSEEDTVVCFCYRKTTAMLKKEFKECGSLKALEEKTNVGLACGGCRVVLHSLFGEAPSDINHVDDQLGLDLLASSLALAQ